MPPVQGNSKKATRMPVITIAGFEDLWIQLLTVSQLDGVILRIKKLFGVIASSPFTIPNTKTIIEVIKDIKL